MCGASSRASGGDTGREDLTVSDGERHLRQWPRRRTSKLSSGAQIEESFVAGAMEHALFRLGNHRARQVRALLSEGHELRVGEPDEDARVVDAWVIENQRPADGD